MNVFVLNAGRCGSMTFAKACKHITNYTAGHETRVRELGRARVAYPDNHIESDCRLAYFLGRLDEAYGQNAYYVHLQRNRMDCIASWKKRLGPRCIVNAHAVGVVMRYGFRKIYDCAEPYIADYIDSVNENIRSFLRGKPHKMEFYLDNAKTDFTAFWYDIGAKGDLKAALAEWDVKHNASRR